jgi:Zn-dependent protease with chaperone function
VILVLNGGASTSCRIDVSWHIKSRRRWTAAGLAVASALLLAGCATRAPEPRAKVREATEDERRVIARAVLPLMVVSGTWRGTQDGCAAALGVLPVDRINLGVAPSTTCKVSLVVTEGALRNLPGDELQAALAHELGHVRLGHFEARVQRRRDEREQQKGIESAGTLGGVIATAIPVIGPLLAVGVAGTQAAAEAAAEGRYRAYDRGEEEAADRFAADLLRRLPGGDERCEALVRLFERLGREGAGARWGDWLSTHPAPARRAEAIRAECAA